MGDQLSELLETRVTVELGRRRGKVVIQFGSIDDLERIAGLLGVPSTHVDQATNPDHHHDHGDQAPHEGDGEHHYHEG